MLDLGIPLQLGIGRYRIAAPLDRGSATYIGKRHRRTSLDTASELVCDTTASLGPFIVAPQLIENMLIRGTSKVVGSVGVAMENTNPLTFLGWSKLDTVRISGFDLQLHTGNVFIMALKDVILEEGLKGWDVKPANDAGDNGYFTTIYTDNLTIRECSDYGFDIAPDLKSPNLSLKNFNVENCGVTMLKNEGGNVGALKYVYLNNCGDIDLGTGTFKCVLERVKTTGVSLSEFIAVGGGNQTLEFKNSSINFSGGTVPSISNLTMINTEADAVAYNHYEVGSGVNFQLGNTSKLAEIVPVSYTHVAGMTIVGGGAATIVSNVTLSNIFVKAAAIGSFRDLYNNKINIIVTLATTNATGFYSIIAYNLAGTDFVIPPNTIIDMMFFKSGEA